MVPSTGVTWGHRLVLCHQKLRSAAFLACLNTHPHTQITILSFKVLIEGLNYLNCFFIIYYFHLKLFFKTRYGFGLWWSNAEIFIIIVFNSSIFEVQSFWVIRSFNLFIHINHLSFKKEYSDHCISEHWGKMKISLYLKRIKIKDLFETVNCHLEI